MDVIILRGLPGSGKTTWAKTFLAGKKDWVRINRDDLRNMRGDYWIPTQESFITVLEETMILNALNHGFNILLDNTNLNQTYLDDLLEKIKNWKTHTGISLNISERYFPVTLEEAIRRDALRESPVGAKVIRRMYYSYLAPKAPEYIKGAKEAIIVDLDGTLALHGHRNPYDASTADQDEPNLPVLDYVLYYMSKEHRTVIFLSGRDEKYREPTEKFLNKYGLLTNDSLLLMRASEDNRKDSVIKQEIYKTHIYGKYNVHLVLDDRNQVVEMWRNIGLTCWQVNEGNF